MTQAPMDDIDAGAWQEVTSCARRVRRLRDRLASIEDGCRRAQSPIDEAREVEASTRAIEQKKAQLVADAFLTGEAPNTREIDAHLAETGRLRASLAKKGKVAKQAFALLEGQKLEIEAELAAEVGRLTHAQERVVRETWQAGVAKINTALEAIEAPLRQASAAAEAARKIGFSLADERIRFERFLSDLRRLLVDHPLTGLNPPAWLAPRRVESSGFAWWATAVLHDEQTLAAADALAAALREPPVDDAGGI